MMKKLIVALLSLLMLTSVFMSTAAALEPYGNNLSMRKNWLRNSPDYQFSEAYKTSLWYENFTSLELSENHRNNVLRIAFSQLGYHEGNSAEDYDGKNYAGSRNYVEYARLPVTKNGGYYAEDEPLDVPHYEWCAAFVNWCISMARIDYAGMEIGCQNWIEQLRAAKNYETSAAYGGKYTPKPADMIFFNWDNRNAAAQHIGLVIATDDTYVYTIEGNKNNAVVLHQYRLNDPCVIGYGAPDYPEGNEPTFDYTYRDGYPVGRYIAGMSNTSLFGSTDGRKRICRVPIGAVVILERVENDYAYVTYGDKEGYIPLSKIALMDKIQENVTVTYDPNGGHSGPDAVTVKYHSEVTLPEKAPRLDGDTFLGWATVPYAYQVEYRPGDTVKPRHDLTLYAVWEKHSLELAEEAINNGNAVDFDHPDHIENNGALLLGTLPDLTAFPTLNGTKLTAVPTEHALAFTSTDAHEDPYAVLDYPALMQSLRLDPLSADKVDFLVLRVRNVSLSNRIFKLTYQYESGEPDSLNTLSAILGEGTDWQYVVFDLRDQKSWTGDIGNLRIDWERSADAADETLYISDIYFARNEAMKDALLKDRYVFPPQAVKEPETTAPETDTAAPGTALPTDTTGADAAVTTAPGSESETTKDAGGCTSVIAPVSTVIVLFALGAALPLLLKKKHTL